MDILIISIRALGDVLRTTFIAQALKEKYKNHDLKISWITDKRAIPLFVNNPYVDFVISEEDMERVKSKSFDLVINLEDSKECCNFVSSLTTRKIIGAFLNKLNNIDYSPESSYWFDMSLSSKLGPKKADELKKNNKKTHRQLISEMINVRDYEKYEPFLRLTKKQREISKEFLKRHNLTRGDLIIGINTGAADTWPKSLSVKKTVKIIDKLYKKYDAKILLFGGPNEIERNKEIHKSAKSPIIDTGCGSDLFEFPALISVCSLFITTDSLGLHVALALKRKTICLVGPTSPSELSMYGLGEKIVARSKEVATYRHATKNCMEKILLEEVFKEVDKIIQQRITLLITAYNEPRTIGKAIEAAINQKTSKKYEIIVSAPDKETLEVAKNYSRRYNNLQVFQDPGKGKSHALNILFEKIKTDILILSDGDVYINENAIEEISNLFLDPEIGCVTGRPIPLEGNESKYGYWANFLFEAAHKWRQQSFQENSFIECSGYLFAFRKNKVTKVPLDVAEDTVIPYYLWEKGYSIGYAEKAEVYVRNVNNWRDWINQKKRTSKAHETLSRYVDTKTTPRAKTFRNEARGIIWAIKHPSNLKQVFWTIELISARLIMWLSVFFDTRIKNKHYGDAWQRVESTK